MNDKIFGYTFVAGLAIGYLAGWYITKKKDERIVQEEIDSVKETFRRRMRSTPEDYIRPISTESPARAAAERAKSKPDIEEYMSRIEGHGYTDYSAYSRSPNAEPEKKEENVDMNVPYIISPDQFDEENGHEKVSLTYYADGVIADEDDDKIDDIDDTIGADAVNHFGEYEEDSVFVRNDNRKSDYEVLRDDRTYSEVVGPEPQMEE